jgi:hypothetical protein
MRKIVMRVTSPGKIANGAPSHGCAIFLRWRIDWKRLSAFHSTTGWRAKPVVRPKTPGAAARSLNCESLLIVSALPHCGAPSFLRPAQRMIHLVLQSELHADATGYEMLFAGEDDGGGRGIGAAGVFDSNAEGLRRDAAGQFGQHYRGVALRIGRECAGGHGSRAAGRDDP